MKRIIILLALAFVVLSACVSNKTLQAEREKTQILDARQNKQETELEMLRKEYLQVKQQIEELSMDFEQQGQILLTLAPLQDEMEASAEDLAFLQDQVATLVDRMADVINDQNLSNQKQADSAATLNQELAKLQDKTDKKLAEILNQEIAKLRQEIQQIEDDTDFILDAFTDNLVDLKHGAMQTVSQDELSVLIEEHEQIAETLTELTDEVRNILGENYGNTNLLKADLDDLREIVVDLYSEFASSGMVASEDMEQRLGEESNKRVSMMDDLLTRMANMEDELKGNIGQKSAVVGGEIQELRDEMDQLNMEIGTLREEQLSSFGDVKQDVISLRKTVESLSSNLGGMSSDLTDLEYVIQDERAKKAKRRQLDIKAQYNAALNAYNKHKNEESILMFEDFIHQYKDENLSPNAYYWLAENYYAGKKWSTAVDYFQEVIDRYPQHDKAKDAYLKLGMTYYNMDMKHQARDVFQLIKDQFPKYKRMDLVNKYLQLTANL